MEGFEPRPTRVGNSCREIENANRANRADFRSPLGDARDEEVGTQRASRYLPTHTSLVDAIGRRVKSVRTAWEYTCDKAGLSGLQLRDLRHEAGSRFEEADSTKTRVKVR